MKRPRKQIVLLTLSISILVASSAWAGNPSLDNGQERILAGHGFLPSAYVTDPWVSTIFQNHTGGGVAIGLETPFTNLDGDEIFVLKGDVFYATLGLGFQQRFGDKIAIGASFAGKVRTGTTAQSLVAEGANVDRSVNLLSKYRLVRSESSQFTMGLSWDYDKTFVITPQEFARAIIEDQDLDTASLLHSIKG